MNTHTRVYTRSLGLVADEILAEGWNEETYRWTGNPRTYLGGGEFAEETREWPPGFSARLLEDALKKDGAWLD